MEHSINWDVGEKWLKITPNKRCINPTTNSALRGGCSLNSQGRQRDAVSLNDYQSQKTHFFTDLPFHEERNICEN